MTKAHAAMTLWALSERYDHKVTCCTCKARSKSDKCAGRALGTAYKVAGRWACASCARKHAMDNE